MTTKQLQGIATALAFIFISLAGLLGGLWWLFSHETVYYGAFVVVLLIYGLGMFASGIAVTYTIMQAGIQLAGENFASATLTRRDEAKSTQAMLNLASDLTKFQRQLASEQQSSLPTQPPSHVFVDNPHFVVENLPPQT